MRLLMLALVLGACPKSSGESGEGKRSTAFPTAKERVAYLCDYAICPSPPLDAAWHIYPGNEGTIVHAVVKIDVNDVHRWSMGCDNLTVETRPKWLSEVIGPTGWKLKSIPDTWRCAGEKRVIHVKEGIVIRALLRESQ
jgi:hypothetical protein